MSVRDLNSSFLIILQIKPKHFTLFCYTQMVPNPMNSCSSVVTEATHSGSSACCETRTNCQFLELFGVNWNLVSLNMMMQPWVSHRFNCQTFVENKRVNSTSVKAYLTGAMFEITLLACSRKNHLSYCAMPNDLHRLPVIRITQVSFWLARIWEQFLRTFKADHLKETYKRTLPVSSMQFSFKSNMLQPQLIPNSII